MVEMPEFIRQSNNCMDEESLDGFISYIALNPESGDVMSGTGGTRKVRWTGDSNKGKRGGVRVIYYYHNTGMPIFLFTVYPKNKKDNISKAEKNALRSIVKQLVNTYET
ncbi:MAG: type II toxin-antitoxin system RelE/ParE family toxin [Gammaproteobacteria bacterium]|nr:type II toxin-antitoxin system RelE/ParE family toxin [Gammaproteobacteria bacterium]